MSKGADVIRELLREATERQDKIAASVYAAERTLVNRRAKLTEAQAEVSSLNSDLAAIEHRAHLRIVESR